MLRIRFVLVCLVFRSLLSVFISVDISRLYCIGFVLCLFFSVQFITGVLLALVFSVVVDLFFVVWFFSSCVSFHWLHRCGHVVGTSFVFLLMYVHVLRGFVFSVVVSSSSLVFFVGFVVFVVCVVVGFMGYVLPCSQMSF
jgi:ubiquinol-cytochrome c reductase cytochrome b subunit